MKFLAVLTGVMALVLLSTSSAMAAVSVHMTNTGADSNNSAEVSIEKSYSVHQSNRSRVVNDISVRSNTGKNTANKNTGNGFIDTGDVFTGIAVNNSGNSNIMSLDDCGCEDPEVEVTLTETGFDSRNRAEAWLSNHFDRSQRNFEYFRNAIHAGGQTGQNESDSNTGDGESFSGTVETIVEVMTEGGFNGD